MPLPASPSHQRRHVQRRRHSASQPRSGTQTRQQKAEQVLHTLGRLRDGTSQELVENGAEECVGDGFQVSVGTDLTPLDSGEQAVDEDLMLSAGVVAVEGFRCAGSRRPRLSARGPSPRARRPGLPPRTLRTRPPGGRWHPWPPPPEQLRRRTRWRGSSAGRRRRPGPTARASGDRGSVCRHQRRRRLSPSTVPRNRRGAESPAPRRGWPHPAPCPEAAPYVALGAWGHLRGRLCR